MHISIAVLRLPFFSLIWVLNGLEMQFGAHLIWCRAEESGWSFSFREWREPFVYERHIGCYTANNEMKHSPLFSFHSGVFDCMKHCERFSSQWLICDVFWWMVRLIVLWLWRVDHLNRADHTKWFMSELFSVLDCVWRTISIGLGFWNGIYYIVDLRRIMEPSFWFSTSLCH